MIFSLSSVQSNTYLNCLFWFCYVIAIIIGTEVFAYLWHRYGAHADYIPGIHDTHKIHHILDLDLGHEADEDFVWILLIMVLIELIMGIIVMIGIISGVLALVSIIVSLVVFWWNWWIHKAYHQPNHWLNSYEWFKKERERHYVHHYNPRKNYGIASHFSDKIMGTWTEPITTSSN
jgi:sterol desaturase/sphingolipid hydroxylase (fatty acid hydroxylase superfamily)